MMNTRILAALLLASLVGATGCLPAVIKRTIQPAWVGTPKARLTGYFAQNPDHQEWVFGSVSHDAVLDEATLAVTEANNTCFDLVIRTGSKWDEPIEQLHPTCKVAKVEEEALVEGETIAVHDYSVMGSREVFSLEGVSVGKYLGLSLQEPEEKTFRVLERQARVCCPITASAPIRLTLKNSRLSVFDPPYRIAFEWASR